MQEQVRVTEEMHSFCGTSLQSYALTLEDLAAAFVAGDETVVPPSREAVYIALAGVKHVPHSSFYLFICLSSNSTCTLLLFFVTGERSTSGHDSV